MHARFLYPLGFGILATGLWEVLWRALRIPLWILPAPSGVMLKLYSMREYVWPHIRVTVIEVLAGFVIAFVLAITIAALVIFFEQLGWVLLPYIVIVRTIPILAIAPLLLMWFGFGLWPKIAVVILISFFPIVINAIRGLRSTDYRIMELMDSVSATRMQVCLKVRTRASLPLVFAGLKIAITSSVIGAVVGEFIGADTGLGYLIINASTRLDTELLFSAMVLLAALGLSLFGLVAAAERYFVFWGHQEST